VPTQDDVGLFLDQLRHALRLGPSDGERVVSEFRAHLADSIANAEARGMAREDAVRSALARIGDPAVVARAYDGRHRVHDAAVLLGAMACLGVAAWLFVVAASVVRLFDPTRVAFWNAVGFGYLTYAAITAGYVVIARRSRVGRVFAAGSSVAAVLAGAAFAVPMLLTDGDFEGYIVLMGVVLAGQGAVVLAHLARRRSPIAAA
jgi:hypothetical protein